MSLKINHKIWFVVVLGLLVPTFAFAAPYVPLEPLPFVPANTGGNLPALLQGLFQLLVIGGAGIAVLMITIGGIQYMTGDSLHQKGEGKARIQGAVLGLILLLGTYIILRAINPDLLNFDLRSITQVGSRSGGTATGGNAGGGRSPATPGPGSITTTPLPNITPGTYQVTMRRPDGSYTTLGGFNSIDDCNMRVYDVGQEPDQTKMTPVTPCEASR